MSVVRVFVVSVAAASLCGCASSYRWRPAVPAEMRTVAVPTFRNDSDLQEIGAVAARQVLREFQREGTFAVRTSAEAAVEVQGEVLSISSSNVAYNRRSRLRIAGYEMQGRFRVSVVDRKSGKVLVDNRVYSAQATYAAGSDASTANRDASGRLAEDLARQVVDDVLGLKWEE